MSVEASFYFFSTMMEKKLMMLIIWTKSLWMLSPRESSSVIRKSFLISTFLILEKYHWRWPHRRLESALFPWRRRRCSFWHLTTYACRIGHFLFSLDFFQYRDLFFWVSNFNKSDVHLKEGQVLELFVGGFLKEWIRDLHVGHEGLMDFMDFICGWGWVESV